MIFFQILGILLGIWVCLFFLIPWLNLYFADPFAFQSFPLLIAGKSIANLIKKWEERRSVYSALESSYTYSRNSRREIMTISIAVFVGCIVQAWNRAIIEIPFDFIQDSKDYNACANYGGCPSGPELLKEASALSVLFNTRFYTEAEEFGIKWERGLDGTIYSMTAPKTVKTRYRVPVQKMWRYESVALQFRQKGKLTRLNSQEGNGTTFRGFREVINVKVWYSNEEQVIKVQINENVAKFSYRECEVKVDQTLETIRIKGEPKNCTKIHKEFRRLEERKFKNMIQLAIENGYIGVDRLQFWKVLLAGVLNEHPRSEEDNLLGLKIADREISFLSKTGRVLVFLLMIFSIFWIVIDLFFDQQFFFFLSNFIREYDDREPIMIF